VKADFSAVPFHPVPHRIGAVNGMSVQPATFQHDVWTCKRSVFGQLPAFFGVFAELSNQRLSTIDTLFSYSILRLRV